MSSPVGSATGVVELDRALDRGGSGLEKGRSRRGGGVPGVPLPEGACSSVLLRLLSPPAGVSLLEVVLGPPVPRLLMPGFAGAVLLRMVFSPPVSLLPPSVSAGAALLAVVLGSPVLLPLSLATESPRFSGGFLLSWYVAGFGESTAPLAAVFLPGIASASSLFWG